MPLIINADEIQAGRMGSTADVFPWMAADPANLRFAGTAIVKQQRAMPTSPDVSAAMGAAVKAEQALAGEDRPQAGPTAQQMNSATALAVASWGQRTSSPPWLQLIGEPVLRRRFEHLYRWWKNDTCVVSSTTKMVNHPAYQGIIAMGWRVVPLILRELEQQPDHWFTALKLITDEDPVPVAGRGRVKEMARVWLDWGRARGVR